MSEVLCNNTQCGFRNGVFCKKKYVMVNQYGQCEEMWTKQGYMEPFTQERFYQQQQEANASSKNDMNDKETPEKTSELKTENDETKGKKTDDESI